MHIYNIFWDIRFCFCGQAKDADLSGFSADDIKQLSSHQLIEFLAVLLHEVLKPTQTLLTLRFNSLKNMSVVSAYSLSVFFRTLYLSLMWRECSRCITSTVSEMLRSVSGKQDRLWLLGYLGGVGAACWRGCILSIELKCSDGKYSHLMQKSIFFFVFRLQMIILFSTLKKLHTVVTSCYMFYSLQKHLWYYICFMQIPIYTFKITPETSSSKSVNMSDCETDAATLYI